MAQNNIIQVTKDNIDSLSMKDYKFYIMGIGYLKSKKKILEGLNIGLTNIKAIKRNQTDLEQDHFNNSIDVNKMKIFRKENKTQ